VDPLELNRIVEKAKADATAVGAFEAPRREIDAEKLGSVQREVEDSDIERLSGWLESLAEDSVEEENLSKLAEAERSRNMNVAKLLTALDTLMEVGR